MLGQEDFGPAKPTVIQQTTQVVTDISKGVERMTGIPNIAWYVGIGLIGYVAYQYTQNE